VKLICEILPRFFGTGFFVASENGKGHNLQDRRLFHGHASIIGNRRVLSSTGRSFCHHGLVRAAPSNQPFSPTIEVPEQNNPPAGANPDV
jgi:hypothetical protein